MITKQYYPELDIVKGIAILCVISAHCINDEMVIPQTLYYFLHVFSMPLFMLASGFLFSMKDKWKSFLEKKSKTISNPLLFLWNSNYCYSLCRKRIFKNW